MEVVIYMEKKDMVELIDKEQEEITRMCININEENRSDQENYAYNKFLDQSLNFHS